MIYVSSQGSTSTILEILPLGDAAVAAAGRAAGVGAGLGGRQLQAVLPLRLPLVLTQDQTRLEQGEESS